MPTTAGIDIGSEAIKAVVLGRTAKTGPVEVISAGSLPLGELGHMEDSQDKTLALGLKLKELVKTARVRGECRRVGVSGKNTSLRYLQVPPVPSWRLEMLVKYEVDEKGGDKEPSTFDYRTLDVPDAGGQDTVLIGSIKEAAAVETMAMAKGAGLGEVELDLEAVALYNAYYHGHGFDVDKTVLIVDIGCDDVTILLCRNGALYFARTLMGGGRRFTNVLADELKIDLPEAEELKRTQAQISFDTPPSTGRTRVLRPSLTNVIRPTGNTVLDARAAAQSPAPAAEIVTDESTLPPGAGSTLLSEDKPKSEEAPAPVARNQEPATVRMPEVMTSPSGLENNEPTALINLAKTPDLSDDKRKRQITAALVREAASLCAALENAVLFSKQQTKLRDLKVDRIYLCGGGSKLKGLTEFMSRRMRLEVLPLEPLRQLGLSRFSAEQAAALKAEQHTMAIAVGLAVSDLEKGSFSFVLWPEVLKQRKLFWARGAYLYYTAALVMAALGLFLYTPYRNAEALSGNDEVAKSMVADALKQKQELDRLMSKVSEKLAQNRTIIENVGSGQYFLNLIAELKDTKVISDEIVITQISTYMPNVVSKDQPTASAGESTPAGEDSSFQTQRRVYIRGFVCSSELLNVVEKLEAFKSRILSRKLFKKVDTIWTCPDILLRSGLSLKEFVLEAYTEISKEEMQQGLDGQLPAPEAAKPTAQGDSLPRSQGMVERPAVDPMSAAALQQRLNTSPPAAAPLVEAKPAVSEQTPAPKARPAETTKPRFVMPSTGTEGK